jgi:peroxin-7
VSAVSSDSHLRIFDLRTPASASNHLVHLIPVHGSAPRPGEARLPGVTGEPNEILTHDWNKYRDTVVATAGVDRIIRVFDIRNARQGPLATLDGHVHAVRKIAWSPHLPDVLLSGSYDMSARIWSDGSAAGLQLNAQPHPGVAGMARQLGQMDLHTEFVTGVDWCLFGAEGWCATTSWDQRLLVWDVRQFMRPN